jgi:phospholipid/cholesterol/gamma-HCH transport system substrate-binding protein
MPRQNSSNIKLGALVISGLVVFISTLYVIGKNENFFGSSFELRVRFANVSGLVAGDNIRFAGIQAGTVKRITVINDTTIEVTMMVDEKMRPFIRKNAQADIGTEGLMGNKVVNILPVRGDTAGVNAGDELSTKPASGTEELLSSLTRTSGNIEEISEDLKSTIRRINSSTGLWNLLNDESLSPHVRQALVNIDEASEKANAMTADLHSIVADIKAGKGNVGMLLRDTAMAANLEKAVAVVRSAGEKADQLTGDLGRTIADIHTQIDAGQGTVHTLLKDPALAEKLNASMDNIRQGTQAFSQDMEALKHNFLLRGYFRKLDRQNKLDSLNRGTAGNQAARP